MHGLAAAGLDHGNQRVRDAWCKLQLLHKWDSIAEGPFPLSRPFADIFAAGTHANDARRQPARGD